MLGPNFLHFTQFCFRKFDKIVLSSRKVGATYIWRNCHCNVPCRLHTSDPFSEFNKIAKKLIK